MIYFIRHGQSEANLKRVFAGNRDNSKLTEKGREQTKAEAAKVKELGLRIDTVVSSPLIRAYDTAKIVADIIAYEEEIIINPRITEYDVGGLTGSPTFGITSITMVAAKNAERVEHFLQRVKSFLNDYGKMEQNILMVAHSGVGKLIETIKTNADRKLFYDLPPYPNAEVITLDWLK